MSTVVLLKSTGDNVDYQITWDGLGAATISSVTHTAPTGLTKVSESADTTTSTVRLSGGTHGANYQLQAVATLSTGRTLERTFPIRMYFGAA